MSYRECSLFDGSEEEADSQDMLTAQGFYGGSFPITGSHEAGGVISQVGEGVDNVKVGDRVIALNQVYQCGEVSTFSTMSSGTLESNLTSRRVLGLQEGGPGVNPLMCGKRSLLMFYQVLREEYAGWSTCRRMFLAVLGSAGEERRENPG